MEYTAELKSVVTDDGYVLTYRRWPANSTPRATVVLLNGIMSHSGWFEPLSGGLTSAGFVLVGADRRGSGRNKIGWGDASSAARLIDDVVAIATQECATDLPLLVVGWCWGAALAVAVTAKLRKSAASHAPVGLVLVTPGLWNLPELHAAIEVQRAVIDGAEENDPVVASPVRDEMFTHGPALDSFVRQDADRVLTVTPRMLSVTAKLSTLAQVRLRSLDVPILVVLAAEDEATDNDATRAFFSGAHSTASTVVTVPGRHGVQFDAADAVVRHIADWAHGIL